MPVTTRLQARRALEAALESLSPPQHNEQSPAAKLGPSPAPSHSPPHLHPIERSFATVHGRRQLCNILHHFQGDITRSSPQFPHPSPIYVPEPYLALSTQNIDLPDYVWQDDYNCGLDSPCPTCVSTSLAKQPSSQSPLFISYSKDIVDELRGTKRQRSDGSSLLHAQTFLDGLPFGTSPALRKYITSVSRSTSSVSSKASTIEEPEQPVPTAEEFNSLRHQQTMQRLRDTSLVLQSHHSSSPPLFPFFKLSERRTKFYKQYMPGPIETTSPNWLGVRDIDPTWQGSLSPKVSPMGTCYAVEEVGKRPKLEQIRADMRIERLLSPEPNQVNDAVVQENRLPSFQEVVNGGDTAP